jgi:hypothetical protein
VFIVPSAAKAEEGPFTIVVEGDHPVDVTEVDDAFRDLWLFQVDQESLYLNQRLYWQIQVNKKIKNETPMTFMNGIPSF